MFLDIVSIILITTPISAAGDHVAGPGSDLVRRGHDHHVRNGGDHAAHRPEPVRHHQGVAPEISLRDITMGALPFVLVEALAVLILVLFPQLVPVAAHSGRRTEGLAAAPGRLPSAYPWLATETDASPCEHEEGQGFAQVQADDLVGVALVADRQVPARDAAQVAAAWRARTPPLSAGAQMMSPLTMR